MLVCAGADDNRHRKTGLPPLPNVLIRPLQSRRYSWHAYARPSGTVHPSTSIQLHHALIEDYRQQAPSSGK